MEQMRQQRIGRQHEVRAGFPGLKLRQIGERRGVARPPIRHEDTFGRVFLRERFDVDQRREPIVDRFEKWALTNAESVVFGCDGDREVRKVSSCVPAQVVTDLRLKPTPEREQTELLDEVVLDCVRPCPLAFDQQGVIGVIAYSECEIAHLKPAGLRQHVTVVEANV